MIISKEMSQQHISKAIYSCSNNEHYPSFSSLHGLKEICNSFLNLESTLNLKQGNQNFILEGNYLHLTFWPTVRGLDLSVLNIKIF